MLTETLISRMKLDTGVGGVVTLLGGADSARIQTTFIPETTLNKFITISFEYGETDHLGNQSGTIEIDVYVKDNVVTPCATGMAIANRILTLFDLKGSTLADTYTSTVYCLRKVASEQYYNPDIRFYTISLSFAFNVKA
jgi:hypothetical protein